MLNLPLDQGVLVYGHAIKVSTSFNRNNCLRNSSIFFQAIIHEKVTNRFRYGSIIE